MSVRRFDLGSPAWAQLLDDGIKMFSVGVKDDLGRETVITLPVDMARALCAALLECGFGPEVKPVEYCRWTPIGKENRWNTACGGTVGSATGPLHAVCDICGKRIEVVK